MRDIGDLIDYENENTSLDFKAIQYKKEKYENLLKDIMSLANAITKEEKFIIIGVKHHSNGNRDLLGIEDAFVDDATYQQLIDSNIEPQIGLRYIPFEHNQKTFGVFHITDCSNPPYMMKKDYGNLKIGDSFIRKGSYQTRLTRKDIDSQSISKEEIDISEDIFVSLNNNEILKEIKFEKKIIELPSEITKNKIERIISIKEKENTNNLFRVINFTPPYGGFTKHEDRDLQTLRRDLEKVKQDYAEEDNYYINETIAHKLNFFIHNNSHKFLEEASIEILIEPLQNYEIRKSIYIKPEYYSPIIKTSPRLASWEELNYPNIETKENKYRVYEEIGNVKHHLPTQALNVPLRLIVHNYEIETIIEISIKIFAKNIKAPIKESLRIII